MSVTVTSFYHRPTGTVSYVVADSQGCEAVLIDSVLDFDSASGQVATEFADSQLAFIDQHKLKLKWVLDTHAHADHLSSADYIKQQTGAATVIGKGILNVQHHFAERFNQPAGLDDAQSGFDKLINDNESISFGSSSVCAIHTPGHTDDSMSFVIEDNIFVGDTLFMPDGGTARCDFPGGSVEKLWRSIERIHQYPDEYKIWVCHDYEPNGRPVEVSTTVAESKKNNIHVGAGNSREDFIAMRTTRDASLTAPQLLYPSLQVNVWGAKLPVAEDNGYAYIKIPLSLSKRLQEQQR